MKNLIILLGFLLMMVGESQAQNATLHVALDHSSAGQCNVYIRANPKDGSFEIPLKDGRNAGYQIAAPGPEFAEVYFSASDDRSSKSFRFTFYLSPGDDLSFTADFAQPDFGVKVTGEGSNNNQPLIGLLQRLELDSFYGDTTPNRVINAIKAEKLSEGRILEKYTSLYHPSRSFISNWHTNINYLVTDKFYDFKEENKFRIQDAYKRNYDQWEKAADSLFSTVKLSNDSALMAPHYLSLLYMFLMREKERLWSEAYDHPETFYPEWYKTDTTTGKKLFHTDPENLVREKVINKYFSGRSAEYLYAVLFESVIYESDPTNIPEIFDRFKSKYPNSRYIQQFDPFVKAIAARQGRSLNDKFVFMDDNGAKFNTLEDVLAAMKGKTVLVDMWGTWCGPCREEIERNTAALHEYFKNKGLSYLYIANHESGDPDNWKKLIAYFNLEGTHMIANRHLTDDIMARVKGEGFPTVFIIKKNGTFELSKSPYPINRDILEKQLDAALAEKD